MPAAYYLPVGHTETLQKEAMSLQLTTPLSLPSTVLVRRFEDESVVLDLISEQYFGLDDVGTRMMDALCATGSVEAASLQLVREYDVEPEVLANDLLDMAGKLVKRGLLIMGDG